MRRNRSDKAPSSDTTSAFQSTEFESWLHRAAHAPNHALAPRLPTPGQVVDGKYRIEEELGSGGMGAVFRATHVVSGKAVALKWMLRPATDERAVQRFAREARAAGRVDHPNVVDVYDIGQDGSASYLVMELLHGESLRKRLTRESLAPADVIALLLPAMRGVAAAHREGVIHRDLKPDNIFLCRGRDGEPRPAKVLDFGISTITAPDVASPNTLTTEGTLLGTPSYMAPEQLAGATRADVRTDVYAFGVILYEALTGRVPFRSGSYLGLALAIAKTDPPLLRDLRPEISAELQRAVLQAMHKVPAARPQTMDALIDALSPLASSSAAADRPARARARAGRSRWFVAAAMVLAVVSMVGLWVWAHPQLRAAARIVASQPAAAPIAPPRPPAAPMPAVTEPADQAPVTTPETGPAREPQPERPTESAAGPAPRKHASVGKSASPENLHPERRNRSGVIRADQL